MRPVLVREITPADRGEWIRMRGALWPADAADHERETLRYFEEPSGRDTTFVAEAGGRIVGFLELGLRSYAPGCESSPVPFIEGWYVDIGHRARGVGAALIRAAEARARADGHTEIGSDTEIDNAGSIGAHRALGYDEVERVVCFRKSLSGA